MLNSSPDTPVSSDDRNLLKCWVDYIVGLCKEPIRRHEELKAITRHNQAAVDALFPHTKAKVYRLIQCLRREPFRGEDERVCMNQQTQQTSSYGKYAVFIEPNGNIKCLIEGVATMFTPEQHRIRTLANFLNSFPCEGLHTPHHDAFKTMVGQIHVCAIERQIETGEALYEEALQYYRRRNVEAYRMRLIAYATCIYAVAASLPAIIALDFSFNPPAANSATFIPQMMLAALGGSYFNIVMNAGKKERDAESAPHATLWECIARVLAALIMGTLTWLFLLSDLVPTLFQKLTHHTFSFIVIAFVAGMFNTFIPSLICKAVQAWQNEKRSEK